MINSHAEQSCREKGTGVALGQGESAGNTAGFPLSPGQERLWFVEQMFPHSGIHNIPQAWHLQGLLNVKTLADAVAELGRRHETLRTAVVAEGSQASQVVYADGMLKLEIVDLSKANDPAAALRAALAREAGKPFELSKPPLARALLFRISKNEHTLFLNLHHIIADEWSVGVLVQELGSLYRALTSGGSRELPELPLQFADYAVWLRDRLLNGSLRQQLLYWEEQLQGELPVVTLPADYQHSLLPSGKGATIFSVLPEQLSDAAVSFSRSHGVTLFMTLMAAFKAVLFRYTRQEEVLVGSTFSGRERVETERLVGFFVNTHVLRTRVGDNPTFLQLLDRVRDAALGANANQEVSLDAIVRSLPSTRSQSHHPLFQVMLGLQTGLTEALCLPGLKTEAVHLENGSAKFDLSLLFTQAIGGLRIRCEYSTDLFEGGTIERFLRHFEVMLRGALDNPQLCLSELPLLSEAERQQLLFDWNATALDYPSEKRLHDLFEQQAATNSSRVAVVCGSESLTYAQLNERAEQLASCLRKRGVLPDQAVAICLRRSPELIVGLLAILKAGAAYLPLDPAYPKSRLQFMLCDSGARLVVTERALLERFQDPQVEIICIDDPAIGNVPAITAEPTKAILTTNRNIAYVIYTSGSTGQPKGVALEHRGAVALMYWTRKQYSSDELNGVLAATSVCFDLSVFEIFAPLSWGGRVILAENVLSLPSLRADCEVTLINTVPSAMKELLALKAVPASVRVVNLAGEPLSSELVDRIYTDTRVEKVYDLYGPTETTTYSTGTLRVRGGPETIGQPLPNERVYVLDPELHPVPVGVPGELFIGGDGVARGYVNRPELTAERFMDDPFSAEGRMYRTGDQVRWRADGTLEYKGRLDHQVKLRGFRIELGEVQAAVKRHKGVADAVVVVSGSHPSVHSSTHPLIQTHLVAYVVPEPGHEFTTEALRKTVRQHVPDFMVPAYFVCLPRFPLTPNGKIDRAALPAPLPQSDNGARSAPQTSEEEAVAEIWREVLGHGSFGRSDDFFRVGGHSLLATQVISRVGSRFGVELPLRSIFEQPTVAGLAEAIRRAAIETTAPLSPITRRMRPSTAEELLAALDNLSEAEIEELLQDPELKAPLR